MLEYLRNNVKNIGFIFVQETHSPSNDEQKWKDHFGASQFFLHGKINSCGVTIGYDETEAFPDVELSGTNLLLINFYNSNTKS